MDFWGSYSNQQFYKKSRNLTQYLVVHLIFVMYLKTGGKEGEEKEQGEGGCGEILILELFVRISFPCPWWIWLHFFEYKSLNTFF